MSLDYWEVEVRWKDPTLDPRREDCLARIADLSRGAEDSLPPGLADVDIADVYCLRGGDLGEADVEKISRAILADPVTQTISISPPGRGRAGGSGSAIATRLQKPGVMDPVEASFLQGLRDLGYSGVEVRTGERHRFAGALTSDHRSLVAEKVLANPVIEDVFWDGDGAPTPFRTAAPYEFRYGEVRLEGKTDEELEALSRDLGLSLSRREMIAIRDHYRGAGRAPSDAELETIAQTWSEHCCHKTLTGRIEHVSDAFPDGVTFENLLKETIVKATETIDAPWCLSVFKDNAGVIAFDDEYGISFKVETHNHPSAIEPYGGAGTGIGGVLRDTLGTGLGAKPIVSTDVFCFGPPDLSYREVPPGALHPLRVLRGVVGGVRDYGNRMGIPTASGAVYFDERYVGNPLVFCGSVGWIPRDAIEKEVRPGDRIYVLGGRTGRDGIHGATFSSVELSEESETVSSGAVQIGNAITEKKVLDVLLEARDRRLFRSVTDCGAGGLSSAVGEMGELTGARVELERVPLKYEGLSYWEIWISEAQERMVFAVPPENAAALRELCASEDVECTDIGEFTSDRRLVLEYAGERVCDLDMAFLHDGRPGWARKSVYRPERAAARWTPPADLGAALREVLASPNVASKEWIIRQYDHEVQAGSVVKPLVGVDEDGPGDGVVFTPRLGETRGIAIGCGMNPCYGDLDAYRMALSAIDEAIRNVVSVGGNPRRIALLDNYCWGNTDRPETLGSLVEASRGCLDAAVAFGTPFISGKDSLNNEFRVGDESISIPPTLLISSLAIVEDARRSVTMDLKSAGNALVLVGITRAELGGSHLVRCLGGSGGEVPDVDLETAPRVHASVHAAIEAGLVLSCHDLSEGGLAVAAAEMAFAGDIGARLDLTAVPCAGADGLDAPTLLFSESNSRYLIEVRSGDVAALREVFAGLPFAVVGETVAEPNFTVVGDSGEEIVRETLAQLKSDWQGTLDF